MECKPVSYGMVEKDKQQVRGFGKELLQKRVSGDGPSHSLCPKHLGNHLGKRIRQHADRCFKGLVSSNEQGRKMNIYRTETVSTAEGVICNSYYVVEDHL